MNLLPKYQIILFIFISTWKLHKSPYYHTLSSKFIKYFSKLHLLPFSVLVLLKCSLINNVLCFLGSIFHTLSMKKSQNCDPYCTLCSLPWRRAGSEVRPALVPRGHGQWQRHWGQRGDFPVQAVGQEESVENDHGNGLAKDNTYCNDLQRQEGEWFHLVHRRK